MIEAECYVGKNFSTKRFKAEFLQKREKGGNITKPTQAK
jgi:hypothetical protein